MSMTARFDVYSRYMNTELPQGEHRVQAEYLWIGGSGSDLRSKTKTLEREVKDASELDIWNFDGSSTGQAVTGASEVDLRPVKIVPDPFRRGRNIIVLCETWTPGKEGMPLPKHNTRAFAREIFDRADVKAEKPWFGLEQEYTLLESDGRTPLGWPRDGYPSPQGQYYCGTGTRNAFGRYIAEAHYKACIYAGLQISGINAEVLPGQWEFQIGPVVGIEGGDQLWLARYLLERVCEDFGVCVSFHPKPIQGDWNGSGCHTNFSTERTRKAGGFDLIDKVTQEWKKLDNLQKEFIAAYGEGNDKRLTGEHETARPDKFTVGVGSRNTSARIPFKTRDDGKGYFEDRRPASNMDPYIVTKMLTDKWMEYSKKY